MNGGTCTCSATMRDGQPMVYDTSRCPIHSSAGSRVTGVDTDLATPDDEWQMSTETVTREQIEAFLRQWGPYRQMEAELARLREQLDAALRESDWEKGQRLAAQVTLKAITDSLCLPLAELGDGWTDSTPKILARIEEIVDEADRGFRERDAAEARCARLQQALARIERNETLPGGNGVIRGDSAVIAREALAGPDTPADSHPERTA